MGFYLIYSSFGDLKDKVDSFIKEIGLNKVSEECKKDQRCKIKSTGITSNIPVEVKWEIEPYEDDRSLRIEIQPEKRVQTRILIKYVLLLILLPTLPIMFTKFWQAGNIFVSLISKIPILLSILLLFLSLNDTKKSRSLRQLEVRFIATLPPNEIRLKAPSGISLMPSGAYIAYMLLVGVGTPILLYRIPMLFYLALPFMVLALLNLLIYLLGLKEKYFVWRTLITGSLIGWTLVQVAVILFVLIMYTFNLFIFVRHDEAAGKKEITLKDGLSTLYFKPLFALDGPDPIKSRIQMITDIGEKSFNKSNWERNEKNRAFYIKFYHLFYATQGLILIILAMWLAKLFSKFLLKIPESWQMLMATNLPVSIRTPSLKSKSSLLQFIYLITLIIWTLFALPINYIFFVFSFDMVYYAFTNATLIFPKLSILYSCVPTVFTIYGNALHMNSAALIVSKLVLLFFSFPFVYLAVRWLSNIFRRLTRRANECFKGINIKDCLSSNFTKTVYDISQTYGFAVPKMRAANIKGMLIYTRMSILSRRATVIVNKNVLDRIDEKELEAITAHELGHIKQGLKKIELLKIVSRIVLFPNFLLTALLNSRQMEIFADKFAIEICKDKESLKSALIKLSVLSAVDRIKLGEGSKRPRIKLPKRIRKWKDKLLILDDFLFSRSLIGYSYPEIRERLKEIERA